MYCSNNAKRTKIENVSIKEALIIFDFKTILQIVIRYFCRLTTNVCIDNYLYRQKN